MRGPVRLERSERFKDGLAAASFDVDHFSVSKIPPQVNPAATATF
jgi:hypothetical protein